MPFAPVFFFFLAKHALVMARKQIILEERFNDL